MQQPTTIDPTRINIQFVNLTWGFAFGFLAAAIIFNGDFINRDFLNSLAPEAFGIFVTVFVLDRLAERRSRRQAAEDLKQRLIREMGSAINEVAIPAAEEFRAHGWLEDGSLRGKFLFKANLQGARLRNANLHGTLLWNANLQEAHLWNANLQEAKLMGANLQGALLWNASLRGMDLKGTIFDEKTILPDHTIENPSYWTPETDMTRFTDPKNPDFWEPEWVKWQREEGSNTGR